MVSDIYKYNRRRNGYKTWVANKYIIAFYFYYDYYFFNEFLLSCRYQISSGSFGLS